MIPSVNRGCSVQERHYNRCTLYLQAFEKGAATAAPLTARVAFYKGPVKVMETSGVRVSDGLDPKSKMLPIRMNVKELRKFETWRARLSGHRDEPCDTEIRDLAEASEAGGGSM